MVMLELFFVLLAVVALAVLVFLPFLLVHWVFLVIHFNVRLYLFRKYGKELLSNQERMILNLRYRIDDLPRVEEVAILKEEAVREEEKRKEDADFEMRDQDMRETIEALRRIAKKSA